MSTNVGAKTKGWIKNLDTGNIMQFQFNPTTLSYSRGATYSEISAPGMSYPDVQFTKGNARTFPVNLFLYDNPSTGVIKRQIEFLEELLPPEESSSQYTRPPEFLYCQGYFIKKCVLEDLSITIDLMNDDGEPLQANISLQVRQVSA